MQQTNPEVDEYGNKYWYQSEQARWSRHKRLHRTDGPAIEYADGTRAWFVRGRQQTPEQVALLAFLHSKSTA